MIYVNGDDRIEITSPGCLPKSLDIDDIKEGRSEIRTRVIARFFKEINYIEKHLFINNSSVRELLNMSSSGVRKLLNNMVKKELIIAEGSNRDRIYKKV